MIIPLLLILEKGEIVLGDKIIKSEIVFESYLTNDEGVYNEEKEAGLIPLSFRLYQEKYTVNGTETIEIGRANGFVVDYESTQASPMEVAMYMDGFSDSVFIPSYRMIDYIEAVEEYLEHRFQYEDNEELIVQLSKKHGIDKEDFESFYDVGFYLDYITIRDEYRSKGYGRKFLRDIEVKLHDLFGITFISLLVDEDERKSFLNYFYNTQGYKETSGDSAKGDPDSKTTVMFKRF